MEQPDAVELCACLYLYLNQRLYLYLYLYLHLSSRRQVAARREEGEGMGGGSYPPLPAATDRFLLASPQRDAYACLLAPIPLPPFKLSTGNGFPWAEAWHSVQQ